MQTFIIEENSNKRIDKVLKDKYPNMPHNFMYKAFRKKDIKVNGVRVKEDYISKLGDKVEIYIIDEILDGKNSTESIDYSKAFAIIYEDKNIMIVNKKQGIPVHPDKDQPENTLIDLVAAYIREKEATVKSSGFTPALCHRLDRNTGGLVIIAKNNESLRVMLEKIKNKEVKKYYQCLVKGNIEKPQGILKAYLEKDERKSRVYINDFKTRNSLEIITKYKTISILDNIILGSSTSLLEVELITGRTHQIRAHMSYIGHPILGDGKYGDNSINRQLRLKYQALWAYKLKFEFSKSGGILNYLSEKVFEVTPDFSSVLPPDS